MSWHTALLAPTIIIPGHLIPNTSIAIVNRTFQKTQGIALGVRVSEVGGD